MLGLSTLFGRKNEEKVTDEDFAEMAREASDDDEPPLPTGLLRRLADGADKALRSGEKETLRIDSEDAVALKSHIVTIIAFLDAYLHRTKGYRCRARIEMTTMTEASIRAKACGIEG